MTRLPPRRTFVIDVQHRPQHDGSIMATTHLPFYEVLEAVSDTWRDVLDATGRPDLSIAHFAVVNVTSDFTREMFVGHLSVAVSVAKVGRTSLTLDAVIEQDGRGTGRVRAVLVRIGEGRAAATDFSDAQRDALHGVSDD